MKNFILNRKIARLIVLQRIELIGSVLKKIRKLFGRYIFSNLITKYFINSNIIAKNYYKVMYDEFITIKNHISPDDKSFLSIGGGLGGLELIINKNFINKDFYFIEKDYVSKKVRYGWDESNNEAYNDLNLLRDFLIKNNINPSKINIFDFDKDIFPNIKFDVIISLFSLDYHYDFDIYIDYLRTVAHKNTKIIFDTIRSDYFYKIFKNVSVIKIDHKTVHKSKRIICSDFIE